MSAIIFHRIIDSFDKTVIINIVKQYPHVQVPLGTIEESFIAPYKYVYKSNDRFTYLHADEMKAIADKLDELNK